MKKPKGRKSTLIYISPSMKFNPGVMGYEPKLNTKIKNKRVPKSEKSKIIILSVLIIILIALILLYSWYKLR